MLLKYLARSGTAARQSYFTRRPFLLFRRCPRLRHEKPKDHDREQSHRCNAQKYDGATETRSYYTEERSAQRSADSGPRSNHALGQVEATGAAGDIGRFNLAQG